MGWDMDSLGDARAHALEEQEGSSRVEKSPGDAPSSAQLKRHRAESPAGSWLVSRGSGGCVVPVALARRFDGSTVRRLDDSKFETASGTWAGRRQGSGGGVRQCGQCGAAGGMSGPGWELGTMGIQCGG